MGSALSPFVARMFWYNWTPTAAYIGFWQSGNGLADTPFEGELFGKFERLFCMKNIFILVSLFLAVNFAHSASFDCKKATTSHEKFICNSQELNEVDTQLGATYSSVLKSFKFPELIKEDQRSWLNEYRNCGALTKCLNLAKSRTTELKKYSKATVYTDYKENKFLASEGTIIIFDESGTISARFLGNWMSDMAMDPNKIKGYPFDGKWCDLDVELLKKENVFISKDSSEEISLSIDPSKIIMKGQLMCSPRTGFGEGTYLKR
jgi:uncharacterized protein